MKIGTSGTKHGEGSGEGTHIEENPSEQETKYRFEGSGKQNL